VKDDVLVIAICQLNHQGVVWRVGAWDVSQLRIAVTHGHANHRLTSVQSRQIYYYGTAAHRDLTLV
jgi:hypothetical protein